MHNILQPKKNLWYSLITLLDGKNKNVSIIPKWFKALHKSKIPQKKYDVILVGFGKQLSLWQEYRRINVKL